MLAFKDVCIEFYSGDIKLYRDNCDTIAKFCNAYQYEDVDAELDGNILRVSDKDGQPIMQMRIYENNVEEE